MTNAALTVLIVDDHELVRTGIRHMLEAAKGMKVLAETSTGEEAVKLAKQLSPDVIIMDIKLPGITGLEATRRIMRFNPDAKILVITGCDDDVYPARLLEVGVAGYITKGVGMDEMFQAIRQVGLGQRYISHTIAQKMILEKIGSHTGKTALDILSHKELQVALMIGQGKKVTEIAKQLHLSPKTVNSYRYRIFKKLEIRGDVDLVRVLLRHGLLKE